MKIAITILLIILGLVVLLLIVALITKKEFTLEKRVTVNRPIEEVFDYVKTIKNQEHYSVWVMKDPNIKLLYTGVDGTPGFKASWTSEDKNVGVGAQQIKQIKENESIEMELSFEKPFKATNWARTTVSSVNDGHTVVSNVFYGESKFPMNIMNLFMNKMIGGDMQQNLNNLKRNLETGNKN